MCARAGEEERAERCSVAVEERDLSEHTIESRLGGGADARVRRGPLSMLRSFMTTAAAPALAASSSRPIISLTEPLTRRTCNDIRDALASAFSESENRHDASERHAAVLVPFCNVDGKPGVLLEVRGKLRTHSGEVRYVVHLGA